MTEHEQKIESTTQLIDKLENMVAELGLKIEQGNAKNVGIIEEVIRYKLLNKRLEEQHDKLLDLQQSSSSNKGAR